MCGELHVMTSGEVLMLLLCVDSWATPHKVRNNYVWKEGLAIQCEVGV